MQRHELNSEAGFRNESHQGTSDGLAQALRALPLKKEIIV